MGTPPQSSPPRGKKEIEAALRYKKLDIIADAVHLIIPWGSLVAIFGFIYLIVDRLSGKMTLAQIGIAFMGDLRLPSVVAYLFGGSGLLYGMRERRLRHKKTEDLASHAQKLETMIDPQRLSSGLMSGGTTSPGDNKI